MGGWVASACALLAAACMRMGPSRPAAGAAGLHTGGIIVHRTPCRTAIICVPLIWLHCLGPVPQKSHAQSCGEAADTARCAGFPTAQAFFMGAMPRTHGHLYGFEFSSNWRTKLEVPEP